MRSTWRSAPRWCRSRATRCPCSIRWAFSRSTCTRARRRACSTSRTWGRPSSSGPDHAATAAALEALVPADIVNLKPGQQRYTQLLNDAGGIVDDLMVTRSASERRRAAVPDRQCLAQRGGLRPYREPLALRRDPAARAGTRAALPLQGPTAKAVLAKLSDVVAGLTFMSASSGRIGPFDCHISRSGYTGEDGFEISVAADKAPELAQLLLAQESVQADRPRCARLAAPRGGPLPLRPRHRRDDEPGRGRSRVVDAEASPKRRRVSRRGAHPGRAGQWPNAPPRRHQAGRPRTRPRRHRGRWRCSATGSASSPRAASDPASTARSPWAMSPPTQPRSARP